ncbi:MAG: heparinase II/III-family protein [Planctomycetia bacterium]|nr:heparinase II/III-family protein [Planctomycetia bacterium]
MPPSVSQATRWPLALGMAGLLASGIAAATELPPHPRLLLPADGITAIEVRARRDPLIALVREATLVSARRMLTERTCGYRIPDGKRLLAESRLALGTILHTAMAWRLTGERVFWDRCVKELDAACGLPDWNPAHFLDVAEMATAVAIGRDWLHADLTNDQRDRYRKALVVMAIEPAVRDLEKRTHWTRPINNWSQVCGAGIAFASACVSEDDEALDASPYHECLRIVEESARFYEPDGCYPEGPGYWDYGTSYHVAALALAESLGQHVAIPRPLLAGAAFMAHVRGPSGTVFNFADAGPSQDAFVPARSWLVSRSADAALAADLRRNLLARAERLRKQGGNDRFFPLHLLWLPDEPRDPPALPLAAVFGGEQPCGMFRSAWDDPEALFVAVKGGTPAASHGHMDVGGLVVEAAGRRWLHDLGGDNYNLPGYFGGKRWDYFRLNARSHNVIRIDGGLQNPRAKTAPIVAATTATPPFTARLDLGPAYTLADRPLATSITREISLDPVAKTVRIRDDVVEPAGTVRWQGMVDVEPQLEGNLAILERDGRGIALTLDAPSATWRVESASPGSPDEKPNAGFHLLVAECPRAARVTIEVTIRLRPPVTR